MNKRKRLIVAAGLVMVGLIGGAVAATAATTYTAPKDHAQAFIRQNQFGTWVAQRQVGFTNITNPSAGVWCFSLPSTANPNKSVAVVTVNANRLAAGGSGAISGAALYSPPDSSCNTNDIEVITGYESGGNPLGGVANESFNIVVP